MGEFEDEIVAEPAETGSAAHQPEPAQVVPDSRPADEPAAEDDPIAAIQSSLLFDEPEVAPVTEEPFGDVSVAEATLAETPVVEEPLGDTAVPEAPAQIEFADFVTAAAADISDAALDTTPEASSADDSEPTAVLAATEAEQQAEGEPTDDDLAAAIAASNEQVGTEATLDDIAPGTTHEVPAEAALPDTERRYGAPWWPFLVYLGLWIALAGVAVWQFDQLAQGTVLYETQQYTLFVFAGLVLAAAGVILILAVWLGARMSPKRHRAGLFTSAFIKGAAFILIGVIVWWGTFMALDYLRLGRML